MTNRIDVMNKVKVFDFLVLRKLAISVRPILVSWTADIFLLVFYVIVFWPLYLAYGSLVLIAFRIVVIFIAWRHGYGAGLLAGLFSILLHMLLFSTFGLSLHALFNSLAFYSHFLTLSAGFLFGYLHNIQLTLKHELMEKAQTEQKLQEQARLQSAIARFGVEALVQNNLPDLMETAVSLITQTLSTDDCQIWRYLPDHQLLQLHASYQKGHSPNQQIIPAHTDNLAGFTLAINDAVITPDLAQETRFRTTPSAHGTPFRAALSTIIGGQERPFGVLITYTTLPHTFTSDELFFLKTMANLIGQSIERQKHERQLRLLNEIIHTATSTTSLQNTLQTLADHVGELLNADGCYITLWDESQKQVLPGAAYGPLRHKYLTTKPEPGEPTVTDAVLRFGRPLAIEDVFNTPYLSRRIAALFPARSLLGLPLIANQQKLGAILIAFNHYHRFTQEEIQQGEIAASQIAVAIAKARTVEAEREQRQLAETLRQIASALNSSLDRTQVLDLILKHLARILPYDNASVMLLSEDRQILQSVARRSIHVNKRPLAVLQINKYPHIQQIIATHTPQIIHDTHTDPRWQREPETHHIRCWLGVPLIVQERVIGLLNLSKTQPNFYTEKHAQIAATFADEAAIAIENARLYDTLRHYATSLEERVAQRTRELAEANARLQELDHLKTKFVSDVSHELRTPINNLRLYLDLLEQGNPEKRNTYLQTLRQQTERLGQLVNDILDLSKLDANIDQITWTPVDLNTITEQVVTTLKPQAESKGLKLHYAPAMALPTILANRSQIAQIVTNLLANAINYTPEGAIWVSTHYEAAQNRVGLIVQDTGIGIAEEDLPHVFDRFYRGQSASQSEIPGTGLGLAIVHDIVTRHHGQIEVSSEVGRGSTFRIWLPLPPNGDTA